jgi:hypothetical protein
MAAEVNGSGLKFKVQGSKFKVKVSVKIPSFVLLKEQSINNLKYEILRCAQDDQRLLAEVSS